MSIVRKTVEELCEDPEYDKPYEEQDILFKLRIRAAIRRVATGRTSVEQGKSDRMADLLDDAGDEIVRLEEKLRHFHRTHWDD